MLTHDEVKQSADFLRGKLPFIPEIGIVLGSGLGPLAEEIEQPVCIPYGDIPHFRVSTAPDHAGRLVCGTLSGRRVVCMQGRLHGYEGYATDEIAYPVYVLRELGIQALVVTNASGGINTGFEVGDFMLIEDHINLTGKSPLTGANDASLGTRFPDMTFAYAPALREKALRLQQVLAGAGVASQLVKTGDAVGGGSAPAQELPGWAVALDPGKHSVDELEERLRMRAKPIVARIHRGQYLLCVRTIDEKDFAGLAAAAAEALR